MKTHLTALAVTTLFSFVASVPSIAADADVFEELESVTLKLHQNPLWQARPGNKNLARLDRLLPMVSEKTLLPGETPKDGSEKAAIPVQLLNQIVGHSRTLRSAGADKKLPANYVASLQHTTDALKRAASDGTLSDKRKLDICVSSERDLGMKAAYAQKHPAEPFQSIEVAVRTLNEKQDEIKGCEVCYVLAAWVDDMRRAERFESFSSPTKKALPPGYYVMWAVQNGKSGASAKVIVNDDSHEKQIDLKTPPLP